MNKERKFRGLTIGFKEDDYEYKSEWVTGGLYVMYNGDHYITNGHGYPGKKVTPESVGQLLHTEKNGRQWWEGDKAEVRSIVEKPHYYEENEGISIDQTYSGIVCFDVRSGLCIKVEKVFDNHDDKEIPCSVKYKTIVFERSVITGNIHEPTYLKGDKVIMSGCAEASMEEYKRKVWQCRTDSFKAKCGDEVVFLEGFSGYFMAKYLVKVEEVNNG